YGVLPILQYGTEEQKQQLLPLIAEGNLMVSDALSESQAHYDLKNVTAYAEKKDRKSTRLNSSHVSISYAVFCLKKKKQHIHPKQNQRPHQPRPHRPRLLLQIRQTDLLTLQQIQKHKERGLPNNKHKNPIARPLA